MSVAIRARVASSSRDFTTWPLRSFTNEPPLARDQLAFRGADADREDAHAPFLGPPHRGVEIALVALAVGDQHDGLMIRLAALERVQALVDGGGQRRPAARDDAHLDGVERFQERARVERQRALEKSRAGERHQGQTVAARFRHQVTHRQLGARQPVRLHVGGEHAARGVERDDQVDPLAPHLLPAKTPHRSREREHEERRGRHEERGANRATSRIDVGRHARLERGGDEPGERPGALAARPHEEHRQPADQDQRREDPRIAPLDHGSFLSTVSPSPISSSSRPRAGHSSQGYASR